MRALSAPECSGHTRRRFLIETNQTWLRQALALTERLDDGIFVKSPKGLEPHRAGAHLRHILEFYSCFLAGVERGLVDYDSRRRETAIESSTQAAAARIREILLALERLHRGNDDPRMFVRMEDADAAEVAAPWLKSSVNRELQVLSSHTIHHFALISMTLRALGVEMDPSFGVAPSTLSYQARKQSAA
jgi:uncharacterized damage-inducible protein DinB